MIFHKASKFPSGESLKVSSVIQEVPESIIIMKMDVFLNIFFIIYDLIWTDLWGHSYFLFVFYQIEVFHKAQHEYVRPRVTF